MIYSIIMTSYNRADQLSNTLKTFRQLYSHRKDYEIVVIEDSKSDDLDKLRVKNILDTMEHIRTVYYEMPADNTWNSCLGYNMAATLAIGDRLIIQNSENMHVRDVLGAFDKGDGDTYQVACCLNAKVSYIDDTAKAVPVEWYQHPDHNNRQLHFCTCISRHNWDLIGGFSEEFKDGMFYEDNDFIMKIRSAGIKVVSMLESDALVIHQQHDNKHWDNQALIEINKQLYIKKWET